MSIFSALDLDNLAAPHVARAWFLELSLPSGTVRYHTGIGRKTVGGFEWVGVTDPLGKQFVQLSSVEEPRFGQAVALDIVISGANPTFFKSVYDEARDIEGVDAKLYFGAFDAEIEEIILGPTLVFPGKITAPKLIWESFRKRTIALTLESRWSSQNFPFGGKWADAEHQKNYPGDKGFMFAGVKVAESWK